MEVALKRVMTHIDVFFCGLANFRMSGLRQPTMRDANSEDGSVVGCPESSLITQDTYMYIVSLSLYIYIYIYIYMSTLSYIYICIHIYQFKQGLFWYGHHPKCTK